MSRRSIAKAGAGVAFGILICSAAFAQEETISDPHGYNREGFYVGGGLGIGFEQYDGRPGSPDWDPGMALDGILGYRFDKLFAFEAQVEYIDFIKTTDTSPNTETGLLSFGANLKLFARPARTQLYVLSGLGLTRVDIEQGSSDDDEIGLSVRFGIGIDYYLTRNIAFGPSFNYVVATGDASNYNHASVKLGVLYRF